MSFYILNCDIIIGFDARMCHVSIYTYERVNVWHEPLGHFKDKVMSAEAPTVLTLSGQ